LIQIVLPNTITLLKIKMKDLLFILVIITLSNLIAATSITESFVFDEAE